MSSLTMALHFCFASYYVYNITFPSDFRFVLLFLETFVYGLKPSQKVPLGVTVLSDSLERVKLENWCTMPCNIFLCILHVSVYILYIMFSCICVQYMFLSLCVYYLLCVQYYCVYSVCFCK